MRAWRSGSVTTASASSSGRLGRVRRRQVHREANRLPRARRSRRERRRERRLYLLAVAPRSSVMSCRACSSCAASSGCRWLVADSIDTSTASGTMVANILASVAQFESQVARNAERRRTPRARRGESLRSRRYYGEAPGEERSTCSPSTARPAVRQDGASAQCRGCEGPEREAVVPSVGEARGAAPGPNHPVTGRGHSNARYRSCCGLLRCPFCGTLLTGTHVRRGAVRYACSNYTDGPHPRTSVSERLVLPFIEAEVARLRIPTEEGEPSLERPSGRRKSRSGSVARRSSTLTEG